MSERADIFFHFCSETYRKRMSIEERADLMTDLYETLGYETYDILRNGVYIGRDTDKAIEQLKYADEKDQLKPTNDET